MAEDHGALETGQFPRAWTRVFFVIRTICCKYILLHCKEKITSNNWEKVVNAFGEGCWITNGWRKGKKLDSILLSVSTMKRMIIDMLTNVLEQIISLVNASPFDVMRLDESTNIADLPQSSVYI